MGTQAVTMRQHHRVTHATHVGRAIAGLSWRLIRLRTLTIAVALAVYIVLEGVAFKTGYPDAASRAALTLWGEDPGIRIIAGPATAVETLGGFVVWDAGLYLSLILAAWALTTTTRLLRGDESAGRSELLLTGPIRPQRALVIQLLVVLAACLGLGVVLSLALALSGAETWGSVLFGAASAGYCGALVGIAGLASQVFGTRVGALGASGAALLVAVLLRMVSNSADSRTWLGWLTPAGWIDQLRAYGDNRWPVLLVPLTVTAALVGGSAVARRRRDSGASLLAGREERRSRSWGLGSPVGFAWRASLGVLLAWAAGVAVAGAVVGALLPTFEEFLGSDASLVDMLRAAGMNVDDLTRGFIGLWATLLGLVIAVYAAFRMGATRNEEDSTRAEFLLTRPVRRWRWLGGHLLCVLAAVVVLSVVSGAAMWLASAAVEAKLNAGDTFSAMFNMLPMVAVFAGLCVLVFGVAPRLTVAVGAAVPVAAFVLELVGPLLEWPDWVVGLSPFHHLAAVPVDPVAWPAALVMVAIGLALTVAGLAAFERRDLVGA
jgi:ABC-2 type transport system permease protein